jgi:hypothetical protein
MNGQVIILVALVILIVVWFMPFSKRPEPFQVVETNAPLWIKHHPDDLICAGTAKLVTIAGTNYDRVPLLVRKVTEFDPNPYHGIPITKNLRSMQVFQLEQDKNNLVYYMTICGDEYPEYVWAADEIEPQVYLTEHGVRREASLRRYGGVVGGGFLWKLLW